MDKAAMEKLLSQQQAWMEKIFESNKEFMEKALQKSARGSLSSVPSFRQFNSEKESWENYLFQLQQHYTANSLEDDNLRKSHFLAECGPDVNELLRKLFETENVSTHTFKELTEKLTRHFSTKLHVLASRCKFLRTKMSPSQSYAEWIADLRGVARNCVFVCGKEGCGQSYADMMIRDMIVFHTPHDAVRNAATQKKNPTLEEIEDIATAYEATQLASDILKDKGKYIASAEVNAVSAVNKFKKTNDSEARSCPGCNIYHDRKDCRHLDSVCDLCNKKGHIKSVCLSATQRSEGGTKKKQKYRRSRSRFRFAKKQSNENSKKEHESAHSIHQLEEETSETKKVEKEALFSISDEVSSAWEVERRGRKMYIRLDINQTPTTFQVDTGASSSLIGLESFRELNLKLLPTSRTLRAYGNVPVSIKGEAVVTVQWRDEKRQLTLLVVDSMSASNIMGLDWFEAFEFKVKYPNDENILLLTDGSRDQLTEQAQALCAEYKSVFTSELGCSKHFIAHLTMKPDSHPRYFKYRPVPFAQQAAVKKEIERLVSLGILRAGETSQWAAPIVVVKKQNGDLRLCGDFKVTINPQIDRHPVPRIQELFCRLQGGRFFTKVDLSDAYLQIPLDDASKRLCVINTHLGLFEYQRLPFGTASSTGIFQRYMEQLTADLDFCVSYLDDIIVSGRNNAEHLQNLKTLYQRFEDHGLKCRLLKCKFAEPEIEYLGHIIDEKGIRPSDTRVKAINNLPEPKNLKDLEAFLGRSDFIGGIDNEALEFGHLEHFVHVTASTGNGDAPPTDSTVDVSNVLTTAILNTQRNNNNSGGATKSHLPESPPDSGSEPPFSPADLQGLTLTSRTASNCRPITTEDSLIDAENLLVQRHHNVKPAPDLHTTLTHNLTGIVNQQNRQHHNHNHQHPQQQHNHNIHQHHLYAEHNDQHALLLVSSAPHLHQQQQLHHIDPTTTISASPSAVVTNGIYSPDSRHDNSREHTDSSMAIDSHQHHQQPSATHPSNNIHVGNMSEVIDMESQRTPYRQMMTPQHQQHAPSIIPSDVYMGTPAPIIESATQTNLLTTRKRKLSHVDCCASMMAIKPEPGATLSPLCQQNINPTSPVSINMQQIGAREGGSGSPSLSSLSPTGTSLSMSNDNNSLDGVGLGTPNGASFLGSNATDSSCESSPMQCIRFSPFQQQNWHTLCDQNLQELTIAHYRVDADKGFNFSVSDDAFVCQKKNHFQITCHAQLQGDAKFVRTPSGLEKIKSFHLHFYGVKLEAPNQTIRVEQSQSDRSKKPFYPVPIDLQSHLVSKVTVGRLHFSETTNNNMRKKGRPNPEQRYFQLIVGLHVHTHSGHFPVVSQGSERIIVRASNPGQFESDVELCWQRGITPESIFHAGRVGINTDRPDESLVIHGNLKVSGHIIQPSDSRAKQEISELNTAVQLRNLQKIRIVRYRYEPEFALHSGLKSDKDNEEIIDTGVIAQEVREVLPDAVTEAGSIVLPSGQVIENFLLVNKDRILMENIGAVKELCKVTGSLETRIEQLEKINNRLMSIQEIERSKKKGKHLLMDDGLIGVDGEDELCSNRTIQMMIIILVIIMATCLVAVSTLYFVEHNKQRYIKRYDRYDISHHPFSHDAILVNNNNNSNYNNPRNPNHNVYHPNKNGKLILHTHTQRPPIAAPTVPIPLQLPIYSAQMSSNIPLLAAAQSPKVPISVIPALYPSEAADAGSPETSFHGSTYTNSDTYDNLANDELSAGIDKSALPVVIISHVNKTATNKNKSKWTPSSSSSDVLATVIPPAVTFSNNFNEPPPPLLVEDNLNVSETSSEKVADSIPVNPDFENNSIDGADQKPESRGEVNNEKLDPSIEHILNNSGESTNRSVGRGRTGENSVLVGAVAVSSIGVGAKKIDTGSDPSSTSTIFVVYKNIQNKNIDDTTVSKQVVNFTVQTPSITNKSRGIDTEDSDLQNLGNNNDSDDQSFSETATAPVIEKTFTLTPIGIPDHCVKIKLEEISNCQSACFEDSNRLSISSKNSESEIRRRHIQKHATGNTTSGTSSAHNVNNSPLSAANSTKSKSQSLLTAASSDSLSSATVKRILTDDIDDGQEVSQQPQIDRDDHEELTSLVFKDKKPIHKDSKRKIDSVEVHSVKEERRLSSECSTVVPWLQADTFNVSLGCEEICLNGASSLNITYIIPLSKYLKDTNVELHFVAPLNLHWTVCNNKEQTKRDGANFINPLNNGKVFQKSQNVSIFYVTIPGHGHFERLIELRAAIDSNKNLCRDQADEANVLLQYNIRLVRDCD